MYRLYPGLLTVLLINGCANIGGPLFSSESPAGAADSSDQYEAQRKALFEQSYIDPLTNYLIEHSDDPDRTDVLNEVRRERDRRCEDVADQYADEPATPQILEEFNTGYGYSCPQQVAAFEQRVEGQQASTETTLEQKSQAEPKPETKPEPGPDPESTTKATPAAPTKDTARQQNASDQALSDCYLLTTIRNFSAAREACRAPAENGDSRSQANMAVVAHAFEEYDRALQWAEKAAGTNGEAAFLMGEMYAKGQGVSQNMNQAVYWYTKAVELNHEGAQAALNRHRDSVAEGGN